MIYDQKVFFKSLILICGTVALMKVSGGAGFALVVPLAFSAFFKRKSEEVLFWVAVTITMLMGNPYLMPKNQIFMLTQRGMMMVFGLLMILQIGSRTKSRCVAPFLLLLPYLGVSILSSAVGWSPIISFLKLFLFFVIYMAYFGVANEAALMSRANLPKIRGMLLAIISFLLVGSLLLVPFPGISQMSAEEYKYALLQGKELHSLFKGILNHSQALGPVVAVLSIFLFADLALAVRKWSSIHLLLLGTCPILLYKTSSRTAMGTAILGCLFVGYCVMRERGIGVRWRTKVKTVMFMLLAVCSVALVSVPSLCEKVSRFAMKWRSGSTSEQQFSFQAAIATRQGLMDSAMDNFKKSPIVGNGFQVSSSMKGMKAKSWKDYLSAPVEKGVWITAVLEETGIVGMVSLLGFLIVAGLQLLSRRCYVALSLLAAMFLVNMGEFCLFSMSYTGGFLWMLIFVASVFDALRLRDDYIKRSYGDCS